MTRNMVGMGDKMPGTGLTKPIVLVGMMGAGKSAVGWALANRLGVPFRDSDGAIEAASRMTVAEIFARDGESFFRNREAQVIRRLLGDGPSVLSTGGGAFLRAENRAAIAERGLAIWLRADLDLLWSRVKGRSGRPLLETDDPKATLAQLLTDREPSYALADLIVDGEPGLSITDMADKVIAALSEIGAIGDV